jgi:hypothetical protein
MNLLEKLLNRNNIKKKSLAEEKREGHLAETILRDEFFTNVVEKIRQSLIDGLVLSPIGDFEKQNEIKIAIKLLDKLVKDIEDAYITGKLATEQENKKKRK